MLAALCITQTRRRWFSFRRRPPSIESEMINVGSGRYLKITANKGHNGEIDWTEVRRAAGREASRLLLPRHITPPEGCRINGFRGVGLMRRLMELTGVALLETVAINPRLVRIAVFDPQAVMPDLPLRFLPFAADVRVITSRPDRYTRQQHEAMERLGAVLTVGKDEGLLNGSLLVLVPDRLPEHCTGHGLILGIQPPDLNEAHTIEAKTIISGYMPKVANALYSATPSGCDVIQFLSGLYELSGVHEIAAKPPEFLQTGNKGGHTITLRDAAWRLAGLDIGITV